MTNERNDDTDHAVQEAPLGRNTRTSANDGSATTAQPRRSRRNVIVGVIIALLMVSGLVAVFVLSPKHEAFGDLRAKADAFPTPTSVAKAAPDATTTSPRSYTKLWRQSIAIDEACGAWRESVRAWVGTAKDTQLGEISGEAEPGSSCTYRVTKDGFRYEVTVSNYEGPTSTRASVTVTEQ